MKRILLTIITLLILASCNTFNYKRSETDIYRVVKEDTTYVNYNHKSDKNEDRGTLLPSDREIIAERYSFAYDSIVKRYYPNFIRLGLFESAGFITNGNSDNGLNGGPLGIHLDPSIDDTYRGTKALFNGGMYRIGILERRLRWFDDSENWTWGLHGFEMIMPDARAEQSLMGILPFYFRKRWFLDDEIPYQALTLHLGVGWLGIISEGLGAGFGGSAYINISGSYDFGSIGGFNARAYMGAAFGFNGRNNPLIVSNDFLEDPVNPDNSITSTSPFIIYAGLGVSMMDFLNTVPETYQEFKDMKHSAWDIGILQIAGINAFTNQSAFISDDLFDTGGTDDQFLTGFSLRLINTSIALPVLDNKLWVGTSLINMLIAGKTEGGLGILPLRVGYWQNLLKDELSITPFIEYNYFPSNFIHIGGRMSLVIPNFRDHQFGIQFGYANGTPLGGIAQLNTGFDVLNDLLEINNFYVGVYIGLWDRVFFKDELRYNK